MEPPASSSGAWREYKHASSERTCLPAPVNSICGWSIALSAVVFFAMLIAIWMSLPARESTSKDSNPREKKTKASKKGQKEEQEKVPVKEDEPATTEPKKEK